ncbi:TRAP transporter large permease [Vibrio litoralis]|uniref:TRAP transporter large permease n=1 Tax=Vibrio litoralis TaxID=335972 RepID=UPI00041248B7|nr:TRAP transporter large permease [Vibrio litoralis]
MAGLILFGSFLILLLISAPVAISLGISSSLTVLLVDDLGISLDVIPQRIFGGLDSSSIMAIAYFILAGNIMTKGGISRKLVDFCNSIVGNFRGGMAHALVMASAFFSSLSGSAPATVIAIGSMLYKDMVKLGYPKNRTAGLLVISGGLGPIVPPSIIMVVYGTLTGSSIGALFKSGMVIGILLMLSLMIAISIYSRKENWPKTSEKISFTNIFKKFVNAIPALSLPIIILGGIYSGLFTPTESAAIAVICSLFVGMFVYKEIKYSDLFDIFVDSAKSSAMILFIIATSTSFAWLFAYSGISRDLVSFVTELNLSPTVFSLLVALLLLVFGIFLEGIATCVLLVPVLWPLAQAVGLDSIHFGMIVCISNVVGTMTPPVAVNIFSASSVTGLKMGDIVKGQIPFFISYLFIFILVVIFPSISTFLN